MNQNHEAKPTAVAATPQQAGETRNPQVASKQREAAWWRVERSVWTERMLSRPGSTEEQARVWFRMMDKVYAPANLQSAFAAVWKNRGSAGAEGQTLGQFEAHAEAELARLAEQLRGGRYQPHPARRVWIPKPGSSEPRPPGIPAVRDRVVQSALRHVVEPIFETEFASPREIAAADCGGCGSTLISRGEHSYGFRPGRGCKDARRRVAARLQSGHVWIVDAGLKSYFDTIPHDRLMTLVKERIADGRVLALVESYLRAGVLEELKGWQPTERGTPQGAGLSPLLSNPHLNPLDHLMEKSGWAMVRYADDFVLLCRTQAEAHTALAQVRAWVAEAGLTLHSTKTRMVDARAPGGFDFPGSHFERGRKWPRAKSLDKLRERMRAKTRRMDGRSLKEIIREVNRSLRGWHEYFQHSKANPFPYVDGWVRMRLRSLQRWRQGKKGRGRGRDHQRWTNRWFATQGLFSLANAHEFTVTSLRLRTH